MRLKDWIADKGMSRQAFADLIPTSRSVINRWCDGEVMPNSVSMARIREVTKGKVTASDIGAVVEEYSRRKKREAKKPPR